VAGGNGFGSGANQLATPSGVALDGSGNVYVADTLNDRVQRWAPGATSGTTVAGGNGFGSGANQLDTPRGVALDGSGNVYVTDTFNHRVQRWAPGATSGTTVAGGNGDGSGANQLNNPFGVALDGSGNVYVGDASNHRVQRWAPGATSGTTVAGGNGAGSGANQLDVPFGVTLDGSGNVYVADTSNHRVQRWSAVTIVPDSGPPGTLVALSSAGLVPGEVVVFKYKTGLAHPPDPRGVVLCTTTALADGTASCSGVIPTVDTGALGEHTISSKGKPSLIKSTTSFTLT
jgi:hypothetical protein